MRVLIQWTTDPPGDWQEIEVTGQGQGRRAWERTPKKPAPDPVGEKEVDGQPGWVFALCVQGVTFSGDHYAVWPAPASGLFVALWNDDPEDFPAGERHGYVWNLRPPAPDQRFGGQLNTRQTLQVFAEPGAIGKWVPESTRTTDGPAAYLSWADLPKPAEAHIRHGVQVSDELAAAHNAARRLVRWEEWA